MILGSRLPLAPILGAHEYIIGAIPPLVRERSAALPRGSRLRETAKRAAAANCSRAASCKIPPQFAASQREPPQSVVGYASSRGHRSGLHLPSLTSQRANSAYVLFAEMRCSPFCAGRMSHFIAQRIPVVRGERDEQTHMYARLRRPRRQAITLLPPRHHA